MDHKSFRVTALPNGDIQRYHKKGSRWYKVTEEQWKELWK